MNTLLTKEEQILLLKHKGYSSAEIAGMLDYNISDVKEVRNEYDANVELMKDIKFEAPSYQEYQMQITKELFKNRK